MCTTRILSNSKNGFINQCTECDSIRIAFGTTLMNLRVHEFTAISSNVYDEVQHLSTILNPDSKCIQIELPSRPEFSFVLSTKELLQLNKLVQNANMMLLAYNLLRDENQQ